MPIIMCRKLDARWNLGALSTAVNRREGTHVRSSVWSAHISVVSLDVEAQLLTERKPGCCGEKRHRLVGTGQAVAVGVWGPGV